MEPINFPLKFFHISKQSKWFIGKQSLAWLSLHFYLPVFSVNGSRWHGSYYQNIEQEAYFSPCGQVWGLQGILLFVYFWGFRIICSANQPQACRTFWSVVLRKQLHLNIANNGLSFNDRFQKFHFWGMTFSCFISFNQL